MAAAPAKAASWTLFAAGAAIAAGSRFVAGYSWWLGPGLMLIGGSMLVDVLLPGGSQLSDVQIVTFQRLGIRDPQRWHRRASLLAGSVLAAAGAYLALR